MTSHMFSWENLVTTNIDVAKTFYQRLFGWKATDIPAGEQGTHCFFSLDGKDICSVSEIAEAQRQQYSPQWVPYISVENTEEFMTKAQSAGGHVLAPISPVLEAGEAAVIQDPTGAILAIWHPRRNIEKVKNEVPGMICCHELATNNMDAAGMFYAKVFDWMPRAEIFGDITYIMFDAGDHHVAYMMGVPNKDATPRWITYWHVADCEKSLKKAIALGAKVSKTVEIIKRKGRYAIICDPLGAIFGIMQPAGS